MLFHKIAIARKDIAHLVFRDPAFRLFAHVVYLLLFLKCHIIKIIVVVSYPELLAHRHARNLLCKGFVAYVVKIDAPDQIRTVVSGVRVRHADGAQSVSYTQILAVIDLVLIFVSETCLISHDLLLIIIKRREQSQRSCKR